MSAALAVNQPLPVHPAADLFPMMDRSDLQDLADDIKSQGLVDPIITWQGQLLDGRNRLAACGLAGIKPHFVTLKRLPGGDAIAYVMTKNLKRRHLTAPQRAVLAVHVAELMASEAAERKLAGQKSGGKEGGKGRPKLAPPKEGKAKAERKAAETTARAAKAAGAGKNQVESLKAVKAAAPEVFRAVQAGEVKTVADAKRLANVEDPGERKAALKLVRDGEPAKAAIETVSAPALTGTPTPEQRMKTIANAMAKARPLAENLQHQLECICINARKIGIENIGGLGGFRLGIELTALKTTFQKLEGLFS